MLEKLGYYYYHQYIQFIICCSFFFAFLLSPVSGPITNQAGDFVLKQSTNYFYCLHTFKEEFSF